MILKPRNWAQFQHYKRRNPPWIKLHKKLLDDHDFQRLPDASKALSMMLWLLASESQDGSISASMEDIAFRLRKPEEYIEHALAPLLEHGFFDCQHDASELPARRPQRATPETETEAYLKTTRAPAHNPVDNFGDNTEAVSGPVKGFGLNSKLEGALNGLKASLEKRPGNPGTTEEQLRSHKKIPGAFIQTTKGDKWGTEGDLLLAHLMFQHLKDLAPKAKVKPPKWVVWANDLRLMREQEGHGTDAATSMFERAVADPAWCKRILSPSQLRRHWGELAGGLPQQEAWSTTKDGIVAKAKEKGVDINPGESYAVLLGRVNAKIQAESTHH